MIQILMALALRERIVVLGATAMLLVAGIVSFTQLDIEAYPDPVQPMTEVLTLPTGLRAEEVEKLVTVPTEYGMSGMLNLKSMESISLYGLSDIRLYFDWDSDYEFHRMQTINQLQFVNLPQGITPRLSPKIRSAKSTATRSWGPITIYSRKRRSRTGSARSSSRPFPVCSMSPGSAD